MSSDRAHGDDTQNVQQRQIVDTQNNSFSKIEKSINFIRIKALIGKNTKVFCRDYLLLMILFILPIFQMFNINVAVGIHIKGMRIAVKNDEINSLSCRHTVVNGCILDKANGNNTISCVVLNYLLSYGYQLTEVKDYSTGELMVKNYESSAFLHFPVNYTNDLIFYAGDNRMNYDSGSPIHVHFSKDNIVVRNQVQWDVIDAVKYVVEKTLDDCSNNPKALGLPLEFDAVLGKEVKSYLHCAIALFIATGGFYLAGTFSVSLMLSEKCDGLLGRSMFAGVTITELLISLFCICTVVYILQLIPPLFIAYICFPNPILVTGSLFVYFVILLLLGWIGFFYGIAIAGLLPTKLGGVYILNGMNVCLFILSGFVWPIEGQQPWLRMMTKLLPTSVGGHTMNNVALKGWAWNHPSVMYSVTVLVLQLILLILVILGLNKIKKNMWIINK